MDFSFAKVFLTGEWLLVIQIHRDTKIDGKREGEREVRRERGEEVVGER